MIRGWKLDPAWRAFYEQRNAERDRRIIERGILLAKLEGAQRMAAMELGKYREIRPGEKIRL
jgi:hypothetical protein